MYNLDCQIYIQHGVAKDMDDDAFTAVQDPYFSSLQEEDCHWLIYQTCYDLHVSDVLSVCVSNGLMLAYVCFQGACGWFLCYNACPCTCGSECVQCAQCDPCRRLQGDIGEGFDSSNDYNSYIEWSNNIMQHYNIYTEFHVIYIIYSTPNFATKNSGIYSIAYLAL